MTVLKQQAGRRTGRVCLMEQERDRRLRDGIAVYDH